MFATEARRVCLIGIVTAWSAIAMLPARVLAAGELVPASGSEAPPLVLRDIEGRTLNLDAFRGRTVLVNFWATWCPPCVAEMPSLARMREKLAALGVDVVAVNLQENAARIRPFAERLGLDFAIVRDHDGAASKRWGVRVFPTTFVVDPDHRLALVAVGEIDWNTPEVEARIRAVAVRGEAVAPRRGQGF